MPSLMAWSLLPLLAPDLLVTAMSDQSSGFPKGFGRAQTQPRVLVRPSSPHCGRQPASFSKALAVWTQTEVPLPSTSPWETVRGCRVFQRPLLLMEEG